MFSFWTAVLANPYFQNDNMLWCGATVYVELTLQRHVLHKYGPVYNHSYGIRRNIYDKISYAWSIEKWRKPLVRRVRSIRCAQTFRSAVSNSSWNELKDEKPRMSVRPTLINLFTSYDFMLDRTIRAVASLRSTFCSPNNQICDLENHSSQLSSLSRSS